MAGKAALNAVSKSQVGVAVQKAANTKGGKLARKMLKAPLGQMAKQAALQKVAQVGNKLKGKLAQKLLNKKNNKSKKALRGKALAQAKAKAVAKAKAKANQAPGTKKPLTATKATKQAAKAAKKAKKAAKDLKNAKKAMKGKGKKAPKGKKAAKGKGKKGNKKGKKLGSNKGNGRKAGDGKGGKGQGKNAHHGCKKGKKGAKKSKKCDKKSKKCKGKKCGKGANKNRKGANKKGGKKARKGTKGLRNKKPLRLTGKRLTAALRRVGRRAFLNGKKKGWPIEKIRKHVREQIRAFRSRHQPKPARKVADPKLRKLIGGVKSKQSREAIAKLQAALKKKKAGSVELPIKHHKITVHPRTPAPKKLKIHKPSPTDKNYVKHLEKAKDQWEKKIKSLQNAIHQLSVKTTKNDWPIEYSPIDPPDAGKAAMAAELLNDLKPFLREAVSIKQADLVEGRENLENMESLRWEVHDKLTKARSQPLLPEMYRFIE